MKSTVIIADDHPLVLQALADLVRSAGAFEIVESSPDGYQALEKIGGHQPDIAILDLVMPHLSGLDVVRTVMERQWPVRVILLTASISPHEIEEAVRLGVWGIVLKDAATEDLIECLIEVADGNKWLPDKIVKQMGAVVEERPAASLASCLTQRELEIAQLVAQGLSNRHIAEKVVSAEGTVSIHLHNIYRKLDINSRARLAALVAREAELGSRPEKF